MRTSEISAGYFSLLDEFLGKAVNDKFEYSSAEWRHYQDSIYAAIKIPGHSFIGSNFYADTFVFFDNQLKLFNKKYNLNVTWD